MDQINSMTKTPIAIFTYNRPDHTRKLLESLKKCDRLSECQIYFFCDGTKSIEHSQQVEASRKVVDEFAKLLNAHVIKQEKNLGLAKSIVFGTTKLCKEYGRVIVLEDDFILNSFFLDFMLQALDKYEFNEEVAQIAGYLPPIKIKGKNKTFFLPLTTSCGWATWQRAWNIFSWNYDQYLSLLDSDETLQEKFNLDNNYPYYNLLKSTIQNKTDSWAIYWYLHTFFKNKLTLYPSHSLIWVGGFDSLATHTKSVKVPKFYDQPLNGIMQKKWYNPISFPNSINSDNHAFKKIMCLLQENTGILFRLKTKMKSFLLGIL